MNEFENKASMSLEGQYFVDDARESGEKNEIIAQPRLQMCHGKMGVSQRFLRTEQLKIKIQESLDLLSTKRLV